MIISARPRSITTNATTWTRDCKHRTNDSDVIDAGDFYYLRRRIRAGRHNARLSALCAGVTGCIIRGMLTEVASFKELLAINELYTQLGFYLQNNYYGEHEPIAIL